MYNDCHVHLMNLTGTAVELLAALDRAGGEDATVLSYPPKNSGDVLEGSVPTGVGDQERLANVIAFCAGSTRLHPFYWINPTNKDAQRQARDAIDAGITGFKCIADGYYPCGEEQMKLWAMIAEAGKPVLFHSGILYSGTPSGKYNRPLEFEPLITVPKLRFALAHVSWPWIDEHLALYGHWRSCGERYGSEMFIDTTPGTPRLWREDALRKVFLGGLGCGDNVMFGSDNITEYKTGYAKDWVAYDRELLTGFGIDAESQEKYFKRNYLRFISSVK